MNSFNRYNPYRYQAAVSQPVQAPQIDPFLEIPESFQSWLRNGYQSGRNQATAIQRDLARIAAEPRTPSALSNALKERASILYREYHTLYEMLDQIGYTQAAAYYMSLVKAFQNLYFNSSMPTLPALTPGY